MNEKLYYNAADIAAMLGISMGKSYKILREMNSELLLLPFCTDLKLLWLPVIELTDIMA